MFPRGSQETFNKDYDPQTHSRVIPRSGEIALTYAAAPGRHVSFFPPFPAANQGLPNIFGGKNFADIVDGSFLATQNRRSLVRKIFNCEFVAALSRPQFATAQIGAHLLFGPF